jgi:choline dehydrogenase-like flavoprotein
MIRSRLRLLGGTTNHWDGRCTPLDPIDFEQRSWVPHSGWPITRAELDPWYARAQGVCDLGPPAYDDELLARLGIPDPGLDPSKLRAQYWMLSPPTRFGQKFEPALAEAKSVRVLLHANVVGLETNAAASHLEHVDVSTLEGKRARVRAKRVVICCGGIENARLLLLSDRVEPAGLGNRHGLVGRFFQEHVRSSQQAVPTRTPFALRKIYNFYADAGDRYHVGLRASDELQRQLGMLNASAMTFFEGLGYSSSGSAMRLVRSLLQRELPAHPGDDVYSVLSDFDEIVMNVRARFLLAGSEWHSELSTTLVVDSEQAPNPESRISLSAQRDDNVRDIGHHIGTTRMADDPRNGVVDRNCRVHGVDNLFVAGASVFATSGHANHTLTIVALALRLAEHLGARPA